MDKLETYRKLRFNILPGDAIAFSGKGAFSNVIKWRARSDISHVGIVVHLGHQSNDLFQDDGDRVMIYESDCSPVLKDEKYGEIIKGVQLHYLSKKLESYDGSAWWFKLTEKLQDEECRCFMDWVSMQHDKRVQYDLAQALGAGLDFWDALGFGNREDYSKLFCSELVAKCMVEVGRLPDNFKCSEVMPSELCALPIYQPGVQIL